MRVGQARKLLAGVGAWVALCAAGTGCQSVTFPSVLRKPSLEAPAHVTFAPPPILLGRPVAAGSSTAPRGAIHTVWRPVQRDSRVANEVVAASTWREAQRGHGVPPALIPPDWRKEVIPANMPAGQPSAGL